MGRVDGELMERIDAAIAENSGVRCYVHTVNDRETAEALLQSGVSAVYTDYLVLHED